MEKTYRLRFRWGVSRGRDSYGYNICSLFVNGRRVASCNGGNYDMKGTSLGLWMQGAFRKELLGKIKEKHYGLTFHDPEYDPGKAVLADDGRTVEEREKSGDSFGLERYQSFYRAATALPDEKHTVPRIDGACGWSSVEKILFTIGGSISAVADSSKESYYIVTMPGVES